MNTSALYTALYNQIIYPLLLLLSSLGLLIFIWGVVEFLWSVSQGEDKKKGKDHMLWGLVGMFIIACAWSILMFISNSVCGGAPTTCAP
jgi:uncharacterized membrane protein HdeD (DUF308 family)